MFSSLSFTILNPATVLLGEIPLRDQGMGYQTLIESSGRYQKLLQLAKMNSNPATRGPVVLCCADTVQYA